jgi:hypothetical protein
MRITLFVAGILLVGLSTPGHATIIVDTIGLGGDVGHSVSSLSTAASFTATGTGIGDVELELDRAAAASGSVVIAIASSIGNAPGPVVNVIYSLAESKIPLNTETLFDFNNLSVTNLSNGSVYWIEVTKSGTVSTNVFITTGTPSVGAGETKFWTGTRTVGTPLMALCVSDDNACDAVTSALSANSFDTPAPAPPAAPELAPEPASLALLMAGLASISLVRQARRSAP